MTRSRSTRHIRSRRRAYYRRDRRGPGTKPLFAFLLIACFGILFAGCSGQPPESAEEFAFTEEDVARTRELVMESEGEDAMEESDDPHLIVEDQEEVPVLDIALKERYDALRTGLDGDDGDDVYKVTNEFLNVRSAPNVTAEQVDRLVRGDTLVVQDFHNAAWAKIRLHNAREGYVSQRYIARATSEEKLAIEKEKYEGLYFVNFGFLNVRKDPDSGSEKIGELDGQTLLRPLSMDDVWARIPFESGEGYVAVDYLKPFLPNFVVRQDRYDLPVLHYRMSREGMDDALVKHIAKLQDAGMNFMTFRDFYALLQEQEERDVRLDPKTVILALSEVTPDTLSAVSDVLRASGVQATLFLRTMDLGIDGITDKKLLTLLANGFDVQSAGHTGDDLRSLTNAQAELELTQSRKILEQKTGKPVFAVAYPLGGVNERVEEIAARAGYLLGLGSTPTRSFTRSQLLRLPSYLIVTSMTEEDIENIALGKEE